MQERTTINYSVEKNTRVKIEKCAEVTKRSPGYAVDWIIETFFKEHPEALGESLQVEPAGGC